MQQNWGLEIGDCRWARLRLEAETEAEAEADDNCSVERTTGTVGALGLVGPLDGWCAEQLRVLAEGPGSVAGPSIVYHCVRCTYTHGGHRTGWRRLRVSTSRQLDDGETAHSRRFVERHSGYKAVTASVRAVGKLKLWSSLRCNWPDTPGFQLEGQPRSWGTDRGGCALLAGAGGRRDGGRRRQCSRFTAAAFARE